MTFVDGQGQNDLWANVGTISDTTLRTVAHLIEEWNSTGSFHLVRPSGSTLVGTWRFRISNNYNPTFRLGAPINAGDWVDASALFIANVSGAVPPTTLAAGGSMVPIPASCMGVRYIEIGFTPTSGSGTLQVFFVGKGT